MSVNLDEPLTALEMSMKVRGTLGVCLALFLWCIAGTLATIEFFDLIDPSGSKMADDNDPFGPPHIVTWRELAVVVPIIISFTWIAYRLVNHALRYARPFIHREEQKQ